ncbi:MAG: hypothetical protein ICV64_09475 [Thermoleophilia bacterium]|nr:hypothetical protein [Thermoleophilia bacterium]
MSSPPPPYRGEGPHALWHVSEDDSINRFEPHRSATASSDELLVWAVDTRHLPMYWFPRECPRATFWAGSGTSAVDRERFLFGASGRVHAIESAWLDRVRSARVVAYRLPAGPFERHPDIGAYWISRQPVEPLERVELGDLVAAHANAQIELRVVPNLWPLWERVTASTLEFGGIRLRSAEPRPPARTPVAAEPEAARTLDRLGVTHARSTDLGSGLAPQHEYGVARALKKRGDARNARARRRAPAHQRRRKRCCVARPDWESGQAPS